MALWSFLMFVATSIAVFLVWRTYDQTAEVLREAKETTAQAKLQVDIANKTYASEFRPWLNVETKITIERIDPDGLAIWFDIGCENIGKSIAYDTVLVAFQTDEWLVGLNQMKAAIEKHLGSDLFKNHADTLSHNVMPKEVFELRTGFTSPSRFFLWQENRWRVETNVVTGMAYKNLAGERFICAKFYTVILEGKTPNEKPSGVFNLMAHDMSMIHYKRLVT